MNRETDLSVVLLILACAAVTFVPRILPFVVVRNLSLPRAIQKWLSYVPVCLLTALIVQGLIRKAGDVPAVDGLNVAVAVPTLLVALKTNNLLATVLTGIVAAALLRIVF